MPNLDLNPQNGLGGSSYLYQMGTTPNTRVAVNQKVRILTPHNGNNQALHQMGVLATFAPTESKTVDTVMGIGYGDHIAEQVPGPTGAMTASFERALLYLCNLWQSTGYAAGISGPVRSIRHHRWPFDVEQQLVFSSLADADLNADNLGVSGQSGTFNGGVKAISFPQVTNDPGPPSSGGNNVAPGSERGHSAIITFFEACWFTDWSVSYSKDAGLITESGSFSITDVHDFASVYGEFMATGNDPTIGQLGSIRFTETLDLLSGGRGSGFKFAQAGTGIGGGGAAIPLN